MVRAHLPRRDAEEDLAQEMRDARKRRLQEWLNIPAASR
jgi:hypothetical protein